MKRNAWIVVSEGGTIYGPFARARSAANWAKANLVPDRHSGAHFENRFFSLTINRFSIKQLVKP